MPAPAPLLSLCQRADLSLCLLLCLCMFAGPTGTLAPCQPAPPGPLQEFRGGKERLARLEERFAAMVEGPLSAALAAHKGARGGRAWRGLAERGVLQCSVYSVMCKQAARAG